LEHLDLSADYAVVVKISLEVLDLIHEAPYESRRPNLAEVGWLETRRLIRGLLNRRGKRRGPCGHPRGNRATDNSAIDPSQRAHAQAWHPSQDFLIHLPITLLRIYRTAFDSGRLRDFLVFYVITLFLDALGIFMLHWC
jgi:hypothetical protein